ncbi:hypothetical protein F2Q69_00029791 [Brassica cretica]|uniref:Uncharacterized protein n=1 Tax=Brassica cretica TaxID=69181 RepID=A0A8S9RT41_BRACR|nr:hypothetical protein F2Q69_00029791 [Brassica cretica]
MFVVVSWLAVTVRQWRRYCSCSVWRVEVGYAGVGCTQSPQSSMAAEENDGEPVDDLALMRRAYTNKKTGQIDDGLVRDVVDLVQTQVVDEVSQLQTEDDTSTASTNLSRFRINEIVESSVPKTKGRLVGLGRRSRSAAPSFAPLPYVDPEVLTAQLKDKDDRISALETQMAAQQAGYETQKRLNEQMMEMMKRMYPNESVPKKKGRLVGLGRRSRSAAPSSAPPPYVDPEVLTAQLKDKDDRISALETLMAAQQAGYETQKRLNEQMMEMMKRMYPNEVFPNIQDP